LNRPVKTDSGVVMNVVFLSPHFPPNFRHFLRHLKDLGANVLGLADVTYESIDHEVRSNLTEYFNVLDMHNYDNVLRGVGYFTYNYGKIDRIDSHNEYWLETEAKLRTDFNVYGVKTDQIGQIKRKTEMKAVFRKIGLKVGRGRICLDEAALRQFIEEVGFPVVAKPDIGVGAAQTYRISDEASIKHYLVDKPKDVEYIVEEFLDGEIVTFDGLVDRDGKLVFCTSHQYSGGIMDVVNDDAHVYYWNTRKIDPKIRECGLSILKAFDVRERFFHFEFFDKDGVITPLEVNMRPPGGLTLDMFNYSFDIDCYKLWAELLVNGTCQKLDEQPYYVMYASRKDHIPYAKSHEDILRELKDLIVHHERMSPVFARAIGNHGYILRHEKLEPLMKATEVIHALR